MRDLATEEMRTYRPPPDALKVLEEDEQAQEADICRRAAQEAEAHRLRCVPLNCGLCGKKSANERGSLIIQSAPRVRICGTCIVTTIVAALQRHRPREEAPSGGPRRWRPRAFATHRPRRPRSGR